MQLYYTWTKKFKNIHEQGFSFSDKYIISYDKLNNNLDIKENSRYIPNFFPGKITEVTAIIGANGAGKSNLFELIKYTLASFSEGIWSGYGLESIVVADNLIFYHKSLKINNLEELERGNFICFSYEESIARYDTGNGRKANITTQDERLQENGYIYYSNAFDRRLEDSSFGLADVSTNHLVWADKAHSPGKDGLEYLVAYYNAETQRQLEFLAHTTAFMPFPLPESVFITIDDKLDNRLNVYSNIFDGTGLQGFKDLWYYRIATKLSDEDEQKQEILKPYYRRLFLYKLFLILQLNDPEKFRQTEGYEFENMIVQGSYDDFDKYYKGERLNDIKNFLTSLDTIIAAGEIIPQSIDSGIHISERYSSLKLKFPRGDRSQFLNFLKQFKKIAGDKNFLSFYWNGLSSGELAMLNLYSRLHYALSHYRIKEKNHLVVLIDEGETNMHPEWQASFLSNLIRFFNEEFKGKTIQLIATSHSPFLISDLPKSKINFLDKDEKGNCIVLNSALEFKQTFGANIHTLYADAFFMKNTLMGDFAKEKLDKLISVINKEQDFNKEFPDWKVVEGCVSMIGEPILRGMLQRQLNMARQAKMEDLNALKDQVSELNKRINKLEGNDGTDQVN
jgi:AAA15 family ATPase/GTPase